MIKVFRRLVLVCSTRAVYNTVIHAEKNAHVLYGLRASRVPCLAFMGPLWPGSCARAHTHTPVEFKRGLRYYTGLAASGACAPPQRSTGSLTSETDLRRKRRISLRITLLRAVSPSLASSAVNTLGAKPPPKAAPSSWAALALRSESSSRRSSSAAARCFSTRRQVLRRLISACPHVVAINSFETSI